MIGCDVCYIRQVGPILCSLWPLNVEFEDHRCEGRDQRQHGRSSDSLVREKAEGREFA